MLGLHFWLCTFVFVWLYWLWTRRKYYALMFKLPGPLGFPLLGMMPYILSIEDLIKRFNQYRGQYGPCVFTWWLTVPVLAVCDPALVQDLLTSPNCVDKAYLYKLLDGAFGKSLLSINDPVWSIHRKLLNPAFSRNVVKSSIPLINEEVNELQKTFENWANGMEPVNIMSRVKNFTLNLTIRTTMGISITKDEEEVIKKVVESYVYLIDMITRMAVSPYLVVPIIRKLVGVSESYDKARFQIKEFTRSIIQQKLAAAEIDTNSTGQQQIFLDMAVSLYKQGHFSQEQVESETNALIFEGFEPPANTIAYALMLLAMFPQYQEKLFEELLSVFPKGGDFEITESDIHNLAYLDMVLNESMRALPPIPVSIRNTTGDVRLSNGVVIPAGVLLIIYTHGVHRNEDVWGPEAHVFNPDNFLPSNRETIHPYSFFPFSMGLRKCIGYRYALLACKITLAKLIRNYKFSTDFKYADLKILHEITLKFEQLPLLRVEKRRI